MNVDRLCLETHETRSFQKGNTSSQTVECGGGIGRNIPSAQESKKGLRTTILFQGALPNLLDSVAFTSCEQFTTCQIHNQSSRKPTHPPWNEWPCYGSRKFESFQLPSMISIDAPTGVHCSMHAYGSIHCAKLMSLSQLN